MTEHLAQSGNQESSRKFRFSCDFCQDLNALSGILTNDIIESTFRETRDSKLIQNVNCSIAFFFSDLLSIMDRGFVFNLIRNYCKQVNAKISMGLSDPAPLTNLKVINLSFLFLFIFLFTYFLLYLLSERNRQRKGTVIQM